MVAEETRTAVQAEEAKASKKALVAKAIADDAQKDLDEALPALEAALSSLKSLNKNDVVEVTGFSHIILIAPSCQIACQDYGVLMLRGYC